MPDRIKQFLILLLVLPALSLRATTQISLEKTEAGQLPETTTSLNGAFTVEVFEGKKTIVLPGEPLDSMGLLVGPEKGITSITARIHAISAGRRSPEFGVGLGGASGYKLWLIPAQKLLQIQKGDETLTSIPFTTWTTATWTTFQLQIQKNADSTTKITGKIWVADKLEPKDPTITAEDKEAGSGRPGRSLGKPVRRHTAPLHRHHLNPMT